MDKQEFVSKSEFKPKALQYMREVQKQKKTLVITHGGKPVIKISPFVPEEEIEKQLNYFRGSVVAYQDPYEPVGEDDWEGLK